MTDTPREPRHARFGSGRAVRRVEDDALLTGRGRFAGDFSLPGQAHLVFLRSPHAHARIASIDTQAAAALPGVVAIVTGEDLVRAGVRPLPMSRDFKRPDGGRTAAPPQHVLAVGTVRFVGEAVAAIVAETLHEARDAAEAIDVRYDPLPAVADVDDAVAPGAPLVWPDATGNVACQARHGDAAATAAAFARAKHTVRLDLVNQRLVPAPIEPRDHAGGLRRRDRPHHAARELPDADGAARRAREGRAGHRARADPRRRRRRRRRLRHEDDALPRGRARRVLRADAAAAGALVRRAAGGVPVGLARPRRQRHDRARARRRRQGAGAAARVARQPRRLRDARRRRRSSC